MLLPLRLPWLGHPKPVTSPAQTAQAMETTELWRNGVLYLISTVEARIGRLVAHIIGKHSRTSSLPDIFTWIASNFTTRITRALKDLRPDVIIRAVDSAISKITALQDSVYAPVIKTKFAKLQTGGYPFLFCLSHWSSGIRDQILALDLPEVEVIDATNWNN